MSIFSPLLAITVVSFEKGKASTWRYTPPDGSLQPLSPGEHNRIRVVKAFAREKYEIERFRAENSKVYEKNMIAGLLNGRFGPLLEFLSSMSVWHWYPMVDG